ncbi:MAG: sugar phosphate isomerase/epimerase [Bacteroidales bacterium]|nr:sugar phosphate isomerase/epimerase [Bacteroidales bacterium]
MKKIFTIVALAASLFSFSSCTESAPANDKIGLQLYSVRQQIGEIGIEATLAKLAEAGYTYVETASYNNAEGTFYGKTPAEFKALCEANNLEVISSHLGGPDPNFASAEECESWWKKAIADHKAAGMKYMVQPSMNHTAYESIEGLDAYCKLFDKVGAWCNDEAMGFGYHNHSGEFTTYLPVSETESIRVYDYMLAHTNPANVFFEIDIYWIARGDADILKYFAENPGRFTLWHVKDEVEVGASGQIDFPAIYKQASASGMKYQIIEQEGYSEGADPFESVKVSCDYVKTMLPE